MSIIDKQAPSGDQPSPRDAPSRRRGAPDLPSKDVRRKRPPVLSFLLRLETARRVARVISLLVLDYIGVAAALTSAMFIKLAVHGDASLTLAWRDTHRWTAFAYLITVLLFARADLYSDRPRRPGFGKITSALFLTTVISLVFALASGQHFNSYYIFYGSLAVRRGLHLGAARPAHTPHRLASRPGRLSPTRRDRRLRTPDRGGRARARRPRTPGRRHRRLHLADAAARKRPAVAWTARGSSRRS